MQAQMTAHIYILYRLFGIQKLKRREILFKINRTNDKCKNSEKWIHTLLWFYSTYLKCKICNLLHLNATLQSCIFKVCVLLIQLWDLAATYQSSLGYRSSYDMNWQGRVHQTWILNAVKFTWSCIFCLLHSYAYLWKSIKWKVHCDRPLTEEQMFNVSPKY